MRGGSRREGGACACAPLRGRRLPDEQLHEVGAPRGRARDARHEQPVGPPAAPHYRIDGQGGKNLIFGVDSTLLKQQPFKMIALSYEDFRICRYKADLQSMQLQCGRDSARGRRPDNNPGVWLRQEAFWESRGSVARTGKLHPW